MKKIECSEKSISELTLWKHICNHGDISDKELATLAKIDVYEDRNEGKIDIILIVKIIVLITAIPLLMLSFVKFGVCDIY